LKTTTAETSMLPTSTIKVEGNDAKNVLGLMEALEEHEDIQNVHANFDISEDEMAKLVKLNNKSMRILGVDPGLRATGFGLVES